MWFRNEHKLPQTRLTIVSYVIVGMIALLLLGFWKLQVIDSEKYDQLAERNRVRAIPLIAPRGRMLDREGRVLVDNYASFGVLLLRDDPQQTERNLPQIAEGLDMPLEDLRRQLDEARSLPKFQPILIKPEATQADIAFIDSHRVDLPLLDMLMVPRRRYLSNGFMAHVSGYVGEVSSEDLEKSNGRYRLGDYEGKTGLEKEYDHVLAGTDGVRRVMVNSIGKEVGSLDQKEWIPGRQIQLTIDYDLQVMAEQALAGKKGALVALDPRTGEVLAMASHPAPDSNLFALRIPREEWKRLNEDPDRPLLNRAIQAQLAPGSVFKIIMATAMLESDAIPDNFRVYCTGSTDFYGRQFHCWQKHGHGSVGLHQAIVQSCDVFFYNVGKHLGIDLIASYATKLGIGRRTGIDLPAEQSGLMPSEEWTQRVFHRNWYPGETISVAIGQGAVITTPLQLARTVGGIASGGMFMQPHLLKDRKNVREERFPISEATTEKITRAMFGVVNEGGTAAVAKLEGIELCGKTGSAQVIGAAARRKVTGQDQFKDTAWFVGYAPRRNPEIVVSVLVQEGEHGASAAAPLARDLIKAYYEKKSKRNQQQHTVEYKRFEINPDSVVAEARPAAKPEMRPQELPRAKADHAADRARAARERAQEIR